MKRLFALSLVAAVGLLAVRGYAQPQAAGLPTVDQIIDKHIAAAGGRAAMEKLSSRTATGSLEIPDVGLTGTIVLHEKAPDKSLAIVELAGMGTIREGTDASGAWEENPQTGLRDKTGGELADARRGATFNPELKLKSLYKSLEVTGREKIGNTEAYGVLATPAEGTVTKLFFDVTSGLMVRQMMTRDTPQGPMDIDVYLEDYRTVDGVKQPFVVRQITPQFTLVIRIQEIKHNVALDDALFKRPGQ